ncbi:MAG: c-type cytochrome, partial [Chthoniobacteraceae bacterium]
AAPDDERIIEHAATLEAIFSDRTVDVESRAAAARGLIAFRDEGAGSLSRIAAALTSADEPAALRERLAVALGEVRSPGVCKLVADAMSTAPARLQQSFAAALSANRCGAVVLLDAIETGKASTAVLRDKATLDRLRAAAKGNELKRLEALLAKLPPASAEADRLIAARRGAVHPEKSDASRGAQIFQANCAVCHAIAGGGGALGPQLDGIGGRGADRLIEDILDPNRNVDRAFRMNVITLKNNTVIAGLPRREEGPQLILADAASGETRIVKAEIAERKETETSLMPAAFGETIAPGDFNDLLAFLLSKRGAK